MQGDFPEDMPPQLLLERWFAEQYGWTPAQVGELSLEQLTWFPIIEQAMDKAREKHTKDATRASNVTGRGGRTR